jgi:myo-inositol-1(or 4)-monophosphatase
LPASELDAIVDDLARAVREAGDLALTTFNTSLKHWTKGKDSPVSEADIAVDNLLRERLLAIAPDAGWLSEETDDDHARLTKHRVWVVDPIDGTRAYIAGLVDWTISVALVEDGRPIVAALFAPAENEFFSAIAGAGATCNGQPITATDGGSLDGARLSGPRRTVEQLVTAVPSIMALPRVHSLALRFARVAQGRLDAALSGGNSRDWDLAAADLLVHEASGALTTLAGDYILYNRPEPVHGPLVAAGRLRHQALRKALSPITA